MILGSEPGEASLKAKIPLLSSLSLCYTLKLLGTWTSRADLLYAITKEVFSGACGCISSSLEQRGSQASSAAHVGPRACPCVPYKLPRMLQVLLSWTAHPSASGVWEWCEGSLTPVTPTLSPDRGVLSPWALGRFCAGTQAHMALQWGETGNVQPELNAGTPPSGAKPKPVTKLHFN